ncbi:MAG: sulfatase [Pseudonocardia sp.]|nr:sulfatase [Pseudonocardia sp.]
MARTTRGTGRRLLRWAAGLAAGFLVFVVLVSPAGPPTPAALVRIPIEALVGGLLLLLLPARPRRPAAVALGVLVGLLALLALLDAGFGVALSRPFDLVSDWSFLGSGLDYVRSSSGQAAAVGAAIGAVVLVVLVPVLTTLAVLHLTGLAARHRAGSARVGAALTVVWVTCAVLGAQLVPGVPVASRSAATAVYDRALQVRDGLADRKAFAAEAAADAFRDVPADRLLTGLRGKDVAVAFVESYGRSAVADPRFAPQVGALLDDGTRRLAAAGLEARSAYLTSPTTGGGSWLAHATLLSGLWVDDQQRYESLQDTGRLTLGAAFARAGWRTVGIMPGVTSGFAEAPFYGYDEIRDAAHLGYRGPNFSFATMPDQYTLAAFQRLERSAPGRAPVMAEIPLVSSHAPWAPLPRMIGWDEVGDGSVYDSMSGPSDPPQAILTRDPAVVAADYRAAIEYSLSSLISYAETYGDENLVLVFLGDHQPASVVVGEDASRDAPVTIVAKDPAVLDRIAGWGWSDGLRPDPQAPVWRMDTFRDRFLAAFGPS